MRSWSLYILSRFVYITTRGLMDWKLKDLWGTFEFVSCKKENMWGKYGRFQLNKHLTFYFSTHAQAWKMKITHAQNIASGRTSRFAYLLFFKQFHWDVHHHFMDTGNDGPTARMRICSWRTLFCSHHSHMIVRLGRGPQCKSCQPKEVDFSIQVYVQIPFVKWSCNLTEISKVRVPTRGWPKTNSWKKLPASPQQGWICQV